MHIYLHTKHNLYYTFYKYIHIFFVNFSPRFQLLQSVCSDYIDAYIQNLLGHIIVSY